MPAKINFAEAFVFEVNGQYENRKGKYTVVSLDGRKMTIRYEDGSEGRLNIGIQERIWENILAEQQAAAAAAAKKAGKKKVATASDVRHYIKTISISEENDLGIPGLKQRQAAAQQDVQIGRGDRLIYFAVEPKLFFAVATITADPKKARAIDYMFSDNPKAKIFLYPVDVDAHIESIDSAIAGDATELESLPNHLEKLIAANQFYAINEDDFELLSELIMEIGETDSDAAEDDDDEEGVGLEDDLEMDLDV